MGYRKIIKRTILILILILCAFGLSMHMPQPQNQLSANLEISQEELENIIKTKNETATFDKQIRGCDDGPQITQTLTADLDQDGAQELVANIRCDDRGVAVGYQMYVFVLTPSGNKNWILKYNYYYSAFNSTISLNDLENDGQDELFIRANIGLGGGTGGSQKGLEDTYIKCDRKHCVKSFSNKLFTIGIISLRCYCSTEAYPFSANVLDSEEIKILHDKKILKISNRISWYDNNFRVENPKYATYELIDLEYKELSSHYEAKKMEGYNCSISNMAKCVFLPTYQG